VPAADFTFTLHIAEDVRFDEMLRELTDKVLRHAGFADLVIGEVATELKKGVASSRTLGVGCDVEFVAKHGELAIVVQQAGRRVYRTSRRLP
jgi:hypothetical protein